jgi:hypothetical protein
MIRIRKYLVILVLIFLSASIAMPQEKAAVRVDLSFHQLNNGPPTLTALIRTREDRRYQPVENVKVKFYHSEMDELNLLGSLATDSDGKANLQPGKEFNSLWDTTSFFTFIASVTDDPNFEDNDDNIEITKAKITIELLEGEEKEVKVQINKYLEDGTIEPAQEVFVKLQVKRTFGTLSIGEDTYETDDEGVFTASFPEDIPGGPDGILTIMAFVEDDDNLGNLKMEKEAQWGTIVSESDDSFGGRSLWAARDKAPIWLLVFPNLIIISIWGTMIYLVMLIFKIKKIGKTP